MRNFQAIPLAFVMIAVVTQAEPGHVTVQTIDQLKSTYIDCDRRASVAMLDFGDAANCSMAHEELKQRGFGGDWNRMLAWWQSEQVATERARRREADVSVLLAPMDPVVSR
jgi:hypothetical protein